MTLFLNQGTSAEWPLVASPYGWIVWVLLLAAYLVSRLRA